MIDNEENRAKIEKLLNLIPKGQIDELIEELEIKQLENETFDPTNQKHLTYVFTYKYTGNPTYYKMNYFNDESIYVVSDYGAYTINYQSRGVGYITNRVNSLPIPK